MSVISAPQAFNEDELYVDLRPIFGHSLFLKCEGFNFAGSIKLKAAAEMVEAADRDGVLTPGSILIESSSGNLGVALSMIAASKGYRFVCVTDSRCNLSARLLMEALGSEVHVITEPDATGGFLGARLDYVRALCASDDRYVWLNQYTNPGNWRAHYRTTAPAIARQFPQLDVLFVGAGTTGTLMGCARWFRQWHRLVRIVAVDSVGSVTFGGPPGRRMIPGLGASVRPPLLDQSYVDEVVRVDEVDTIRACHRLARRGFLFGGSTGTVVSGAMSWLARHDASTLTAVAIAPDLGERYLDTIYQTNWIEAIYGKDALRDAVDEPVPCLSPDCLLIQGFHVTGNLVETVTAVPATGTESILAGILAEVMRVEQVPADSHFFDDLGADSLVMAKFCARVRKRADLPSFSMKDIYRHPTISGLAAAFAEKEAEADEAPAPASSRAAAPAEAVAAAPAEEAAAASTPQYIMCGTLQLLFFLGYAWVAALVGARAYEWISAGTGLADIYLRAVLFGGAGFVVVCTLPILAKWVLIGRWKPRQIRIWSLGYVRFWIVKTLVRSNPLAFLTIGSPLYLIYLRALGARIGPGTVIFSHNVPVCTDLLTIGPDTVIRKDAFFGCYRAHAGWIQTGTVTLGRKVFIGEKSVLDIDTAMGDVSQLGHASSLHSGQRVPASQRWHGSPAQRTDLNYVRATSAPRRGTFRRFRFSAVTLLCVFFLYLPLVEGGVFLLLTAVPALGRVLDPGMEAITSRGLYARRVLRIRSVPLRPRAGRPAFRGHRPAAAQPVHQAVRGLSPLRVPRPDPPGDRADDRREVLHAPVR